MIDALAQKQLPPRQVAILVCLLILLLLPHSINVSGWIMGFFVFTALWRLAALRKPGLMPGRWLLLLMMVVALADVVMLVGLSEIRRAGTALLIVMLGLKLLEMRNRRDVHVAIFLAYFSVMTLFLFQQDLWLAIYLFILVAIFTALLVSFNRVAFQLLPTLKTAAVLTLSSIPVMLVLFVLFPRLSHPLWSLNLSSGKTVSGISDHMEMGSIGRLSQSNATAFRVRFKDRVPANNQLYWRGPVLWQTDGRKWQAGEPRMRSTQADVTLGTAVDYEITLEPSQQRWLFALDLPADAPANAAISNDFQLVADQPIRSRYSYSLRSYTDYKISHLSDLQWEQGLQLPEKVSDRLLTLVEDWQREVPKDQPLALVNKALEYFSQQPFVYTLSPGTSTGDPVEHFLFESRRGFCEHYASSFVLMMRLAGIPARVLAGYQGGEKNPHAEHWIVRQSDAHAWAEVWIEQRGWIRVDPTAAVAPERVEHSIDPARSQVDGQVVFRLDSGSLLGSFIQEAHWLVDAMDLGWHTWVLGFTAGRQSLLLKDLGLEHFKGYGQGIAMIAGSTIAMTVAWLISFAIKRKDPDKTRIIWQQFIRKLRKAKVPIETWHGPEDVYRTASGIYPDKDNELRLIKLLYIQLQYGRTARENAVNKLRTAVRRLHLPVRKPDIPSLRKNSSV